MWTYEWYYIILGIQVEWWGLSRGDMDTQIQYAVINFV